MRGREGEGRSREGTLRSREGEGRSRDSTLRRREGELPLVPVSDSVLGGGGDKRPLFSISESQLDICGRGGQRGSYSTVQ